MHMYVFKTRCAYIADIYDIILKSQMYEALISSSIFRKLNPRTPVESSYVRYPQTEN